VANYEPGGEDMTVLTESRNPATADIDQRSTLEVVQLINAEDTRVAEAVQAELPRIAQAVDVIHARLAAGGRLRYFGAGTSGRLGVLDAVEMVPTFSVPPDMVRGVIAGGVPALTQSVEGAEDDAEDGAEAVRAEGITAADVVVGLTASGRTPWVLGAMRAARELGTATIGIACNPDPPLAAVVDICITPVVGPEVITGSTRMKAGTAQKMVLNMLSTATMIKLGKVYSNLMVDVQPTNQKLRERAIRILGEAAGVSAEEARRLLELSSWQVKPALVMALTGLNVSEARRLLEDASGHVRRALELATLL